MRIDALDPIAHCVPQGHLDISLPFVHEYHSPNPGLCDAYFRTKRSLYLGRVRDSFLC